MIKKIAFITTVFFLIIITTACAPILSSSMNAALTPDDVVTKTADYFDTTPENLEISNIQKEALWTIYRVTYKGNRYRCQIYYGAVECDKPGV